MMLFDALLVWIGGYTPYPRYVLSAALFVTSLLVLKVFQVIILSRLKALAKRTKNDLDDVFIDIISHIKPGLYVVFSVYIGLVVLPMPEWINQVLHVLFILVLAQFLIHGILRLLDYAVAKYVARQESETGEDDAEHTEAMLRIFRVILMVLLWSSVLLFLLANLGVNITSLIASLGVGGIAVALALQNVLSDLFASFSIFLDTPFKVGDFIKFGEKSGTVQKVGVRSTRLKTMQGEQLVVPNTELVSQEIQNFRRMQERREVMTIGVVYELPLETLRQIPTMIQEIVEGVEHCRFGRSHLAEYGDSAILFETVYHITTSEYGTYMDVKQDIHLKVFEAFEKAGIGFAYPTQQVYIAK